MNLLGATIYDPAVAVSKATSALLAMTALDTTNLRLAITVPSHGIVRFKMRGAVTGATTSPTLLVGVLNGATVLGRVAPTYENATANVATQNFVFDAEFTVTGLTPGAMNVDAAYAVQVIVASTNIKYGGANTNGGANAWGGFLFEAWDPRPVPTATPGAASGLLIAGANAATTFATLTSTGAFSVNGVSDVAQTGDSFARIGAAGAGLTAIGDTRMANLDATVSSRTKPADTQAAVTTVTNLTNAPTAGDFTATMKTSITTAATAATPTATLANGAHGGAAATLTLGGAGGLTATHTGNTTGSVGSVTGNVGGNVTGSVGSVVGAVGSVTADVGITQAAADKAWSTAARTLTAGTNIVLAKGVGLTGLNDIAATAIVSSGAITTSAGKVSGVALVDTLTTYTGNTVQTGDSFARIGAAGAGLTAVTVATNNDKTGYALSAAGVQANWDALTASLTTVGSVGKKLADWTIGSAQTGDSYARLGAPAGASVSADIAAVKTDTAAVKAKTNSLSFSVAGYVNANIRYVNSVLVNGDGSGGTPWGP